jgi:hypothetical protein
MTIFVLFLEFTAGELLTPFCRSAFQARIAAESRSYGKNFCNDRLNTGSFLFCGIQLRLWRKAL